MPLYFEEVLRTYIAAQSRTSDLWTGCEPFRDNSEAAFEAQYSGIAKISLKLKSILTLKSASSWPDKKRHFVITKSLVTRLPVFAALSDF
jgi:hypothetical protein